MLTFSYKDIQAVLQDFGICSAIKCVTELQRCDYEHGDYSRKEGIRLIVKVELISGAPVVIRFKNEAGVTLELIESQSRIADKLLKNEIPTPRQYQSASTFAKQCQINGYDAIVTVEDFAEDVAVAQLQRLKAGVLGFITGRDHENAHAKLGDFRAVVQRDSSLVHFKFSLISRGF